MLLNLLRLPELALIELLLFAAVGQVAIAILNLFLARMMHWQADLRRIPLLIREVFHVHSWFISATLTIFGVLTWRFAREMATGLNPVATWLAAAIGLFWAIRTVLQVTYYSSSHWRGKRGRTVIHLILLLAYGGMSVTYLFAATL